jgi:chitodextrinase
VKRPLDGDDDGSPVCDIGAYEASDPPPSAPTSLTALSISETQINLSWDDESDDESDFHIERAIASIGNWEDVAAVPPDTEAYEDNRLQCGTSYQYRVRAHRGTDNQFSAYSNVSAADTGECPPPNAPTNLAALAASASCIDLTWQDQSEDESSFRIERSPGGAHTWVEIDTVPADTECHQDSGLQCGTSYDYRVRAYRVVDGTFSDYSNVAGETTFACPPPAAPADLTAEPVSDRQIALSWNDLSGDESDFHVERSLTGTGSWTEIGTAPLDSEAYQDVGLLRHTTYFYRVRAHRHSDDQFSAYGNVATATTYAAFYLPCALKGY